MSKPSLFMNENLFLGNRCNRCTNYIYSPPRVNSVCRIRKIDVDTVTRYSSFGKIVSLLILSHDIFL